MEIWSELQSSRERAILLLFSFLLFLLPFQFLFLNGSQPQLFHSCVEEGLQRHERYNIVYL